MFTQRCWQPPLRMRHSSTSAGRQREGHHQRPPAAPGTLTLIPPGLAQCTTPSQAAAPPTHLSLLSRPSSPLTSPQTLQACLPWLQIPPPHLCPKPHPCPVVHPTPLPTPWHPKLHPCLQYHKPRPRSQQPQTYPQASSTPKPLPILAAILSFFQTRSTPMLCPGLSHPKPLPTPTTPPNSCSCQPHTQPCHACSILNSCWHLQHPTRLFTPIAPLNCSSHLQNPRPFLVTIAPQIPPPTWRWEGSPSPSHTFITPKPSPPYPHEQALT